MSFYSRFSLSITFLGAALAVSSAKAQTTTYVPPLDGETPIVSKGAQAALSRTYIGPNATPTATPTVAPVPASTPSPKLSIGVEAVDDRETTQVAGFDAGFAGAHGALGGSYLVSGVNSSLQIYTTAGKELSSVPLGAGGAKTAFFASLKATNRVFSPQVIFDNISKRFVVVALEQTVASNSSSGRVRDSSRILMAVSKTSNPTAGWYFQAVNSYESLEIGPSWADFPSIAVDSNALYITANLFTFQGSNFAGSRLYIVPKTAFYTNKKPTARRFNPYANNSRAHVGTTIPVQSIGTGGTPLLVSYDGLNVQDYIYDGSSYQYVTQQYLQLVTIVDLLSAKPTFTVKFVPVGQIDAIGSLLPGAAQPDGTLLRTGDRRILNAVARNGVVYTCADIVDLSSQQTTAHWWQIGPQNGAYGLLDQGSAGGEELGTSTTTFYPSIAVDTNGNMGFSFCASGPDLEPSIAYAGRTLHMKPGTLQSTRLLMRGLDSYSPTQFRDPWADTSATVSDPSKLNTFWSYNTYAQAHDAAGNSHWGTRWSKFSIDGKIVTSTNTEVTEPTSGQRDALFTVTLPQASDGTITLQYEAIEADSAPEANRAKANFDFQPVTGTLTFAPGDTTGVIHVPVLSDSQRELDEVFSLRLFDPSVGEITTPILTCTIHDSKHSYAISGRVVSYTTDVQQSDLVVPQGIANVTIKVGKSETQTDDNGYYSLPVAPGTYEVSAETIPDKMPDDGMTTDTQFAPTVRRVTVKDREVNKVDFETYAITGNVQLKYSNGQYPAYFAPITVNGVVRATTDYNGNFTIQGLPRGKFTVVPTAGQYNTGFTFQSQSITLPTQDVVGVSPNGQLNFVGTYAPASTSPSAKTN